MPTITTKDVRVNGYPPLDVVLAYFDALPALLRRLKQLAPGESFTEWEELRAAPRRPLRIEPISRHADKLLNPPTVEV